MTTPPRLLASRLAGGARFDGWPMKPRILIVEDEPGIADTLQYALRTDGFEPRWCATGEEALARMRARCRRRW